MKVDIEWYGNPDDRSYRVNFDKVSKIVSWRAERRATDRALEVYEALEKERLEWTDECFTLEWYRSLEKWSKVNKEVEKYGGILDINSVVD